METTKASMPKLCAPLARRRPRRRFSATAYERLGESPTRPSPRGERHAASCSTQSCGSPLKRRRGRRRASLFLALFIVAAVAEAEDLGEITLPQTVEHLIVVRNEGKTPLRVLRAKAFRGDVRVGSILDPIPPGDAATLPIAIDAAIPGPFRADVFVETDDSSAPIRRYPITAVCGGDSPKVSRDEAPGPGAGDESLDGRTVIDVRAAAEFERGHIPGARHIPLFALRGRRDLRASPLLLVGHGWDDTRLEALCRELAAIGFRDPRHLPGGVAEWWRKGRPLSGAQPSEPPIMIPPAALDFAAADTWTILFPTQPSKPAARRAPAAHPLAAGRALFPRSEPVQAARDRLRAAVEALPGPARPVLLVTEDWPEGGLIAEIAAWRGPAATPAPVFLIAGGTRALGAHWATAMASAERRVATAQTSRAGAGMGGGAGAGAGGCGGCPK